MKALPQGEMETPLGKMRLTVHPGYRVWGEIPHVVFIHRIPYRVMFEFALQRETEEWFASGGRTCRLYRSNNVWDREACIKDHDGLTYAVSTSREITETAYKHIMKIIPPLFEAWVEKNYMLLAAAKPAYQKAKIEEAKNRIGATMRELTALQQTVWELEAAFIKKGELSSAQIDMLEGVLSRQFRIRGEEVQS